MSNHTKPYAWRQIYSLFGAALLISVVSVSHSWLTDYSFAYSYLELAVQAQSLDIQKKFDILSELIEKIENHKTPKDLIFSRNLSGLQLLFKVAETPNGGFRIRHQYHAASDVSFDVASDVTESPKSVIHSFAQGQHALTNHDNQEHFSLQELDQIFVQNGWQPSHFLKQTVLFTTVKPDYFVVLLKSLSQSQNYFLGVFVLNQYLAPPSAFHISVAHENGRLLYPLMHSDNTMDQHIALAEVISASLPNSVETKKDIHFQSIRMEQGFFYVAVKQLQSFEVFVFGSIPISLALKNTFFLVRDLVLILIGYCFLVTGYYLLKHSLLSKKKELV